MPSQYSNEPRPKINLKPPDPSVTPQERRIRQQIITCQCAVVAAAMAVCGYIVSRDPSVRWWEWVAPFVIAVVAMLCSVASSPPSMPPRGKPGAPFEIKPREHKAQVGDDRKDDDGNTRTRVNHPDGSVSWSSSGRARQVSGPGVDDDDDDWKDARS